MQPPSPVAGDQARAAPRPQGPDLLGLASDGGTSRAQPADLLNARRACARSSSRGTARLQRSSVLAPLLSLEDLYLGVLVAAEDLGVRLRPELKRGETFHEENIVEEAIKSGALFRDADLAEPFRASQSCSTARVAAAWITKCLTDRYYGLESLALASMIERGNHTAKIQGLPDLPGLATTPAQKLALGRAWLRCWQRSGFSLSRMPPAWRSNEVQVRSGKFRELGHLLRDKSTRAPFEREWVPKLLEWLTEQLAPGKYLLKGGELSLEIGGAWAYCQSCRSTQRLFPGRATCVNCGQDTATPIDPDCDPVFMARKGYYRTSTLEALKVPPRAPIALIAAEHTAQLNTAQAAEVFSKAEEHELLFQDVDLGVDDNGRERPAIDVLVLHDDHGGRYRHRHSLRCVAAEHAARSGELPAACRSRGPTRQCGRHGYGIRQC